MDHASASTQIVVCWLVMLNYPLTSNVTDSLFVFFSSLTSVCLRLQSNEDNQRLFKGITPERAFGDFIFAHIILHLVVINFIG